jgi:hypothetical protein
MVPTSKEKEMAQHKATLERVLVSTLKHATFGSRAAETVASIEAIAAVIAADLDGQGGTYGVDYTADSQDTDSIRRFRSAIAHREYGKRIQDAYETLAAIDAALTPTGSPFTAAEVTGAGPHKQNMEKTAQSAMNSRTLGTRLSEMASKQDQLLDGLITDNALNANTLAALEAIRDA